MKALDRIKAKARARTDTTGLRRILVTGSRDWTDADEVRRLLVAEGDGERCVLIHGAARGADTIAALVAKDLGWIVLAFPADWRKHGNRAGPIRNQEMVDQGADVCCAFPLPQSVGTYDCMRRAEDAGIPVVLGNDCVPF